MSRKEDEYLIERMGKLLAEIAVIVNGLPPSNISWSYHDLPEKVRALKQAPPAAVPAGYDALRQFVNWAVGEVWQGRDISGGDVQDKARDLGLIDEVTVTEPCSDMCNCGDGGFPTTCYRLGPVLAAAARKGE